MWQLHEEGLETTLEQKMKSWSFQSAQWLSSVEGWYNFFFLPINTPQQSPGLLQVY
jgi:hypothetical protein